MAHEGQLVADRYRLGAVIGSGGMSVVHEAEDERLGRRVAVKILRPGFSGDPSFVARFIHEARSAASLSHPNIVAIHDSGIDGDLQFIVMELVDGPSLAEVLAERGALPPDRAVSIAAQVAEGLAAAHRRGIVHRDVKPGNILLDRRGRAVIADFGIARAFAATALTTTGTILGSLPYLSPEQASGEEVTAASDIYSLGVVLFEMLTGRRPFEGSNAASVTVRRLHEAPPEPSSVEPSLPPALDALVLRAMARDPAGRYPSARNLAQALDAWHRRWMRVRSLAAAGPIALPGETYEDGATEALTVESSDEGDTALLPATSGSQAGLDLPEVPDAAPRSEMRANDAPPRLTRRRRIRVRRVALPAALVSLGLAGVLILASMAALGETGSRATPPPSEAAVLAATAVASSSPSEALVALASPTPTPTSSPTATPRPAATPGHAATPLPTTLPTPAPTPRATQRPRATAPPIVAVGPAQQVVRFYEAVARHSFSPAASLWSPSMRDRYPPSTYIDGRFAGTTGFDLNRVSLTSRSGNRARVAIDIVEHRTSSPTRERWVGSWSLVDLDGTWLLDDPDLAAGA